MGIPRWLMRSLYFLKKPGSVGPCSKTGSPYCIIFQTSILFKIIYSSQKVFSAFPLNYHVFCLFFAFPQVLFTTEHKETREREVKTNLLREEVRLSSSLCTLVFTFRSYTSLCSIENDTCWERKEKTEETIIEGKR